MTGVFRRRYWELTELPSPRASHTRMIVRSLSTSCAGSRTHLRSDVDEPSAVEALAVRVTVGAPKLAHTVEAKVAAEPLPGSASTPAYGASSPSARRVLPLGVALRTAAGAAVLNLVSPHAPNSEVDPRRTCRIEVAPGRRPPLVHVERTEDASSELQGSATDHTLGVPAPAPPPLASGSVS